MSEAEFHNMLQKIKTRGNDLRWEVYIWSHCVLLVIKMLHAAEVVKMWDIYSFSECLNLSGPKLENPKRQVYNDVRQKTELQMVT